MLSTTTAANRAYSHLPLQKQFDYAAGKVSFLCVCVLCSEIHKKVLTVYVGFHCAVSTRAGKGGSGLDPPGLGHRPRCGAGTLVSAARRSPGGCHPHGLTSDSPRPLQASPHSAATNCGDRPESGHYESENRQMKCQITHGKIPLPLPLTCSRKRTQSAAPSPASPTMNEQNPRLLLDIYPAVKLVLLNYGHYLLMTIFRLLRRLVL